MASMTPMMRQYLQLKEKYSDCLLFFRLGDFYEMFEEDARIASRELDLTLTSRDHAKDKSAEDKIPMCGVPYHSSESYIARLVAKGYKVAICEQMEDPALAKGLVKRDIIRIVTPGSVTESSMLVESKNNYYACVYGAAGTYGLCFCDVSTGAFSATQVSGADAMQDAQNELGSFLPSEALLGGTAAEDGALADFLRDRFHTCVNIGTDAQFDPALCAAAVTAQFGQSPEALGLANMPCVIAAAGALLTTLRDLQKNELPHIRALELYIAGKFMQLDLAARRNLELTETMRAKEKRGSLLWVLDKTKTAMGGRLLRAWMERPLLSPAQITRRLTAVEELVKKTIDREELILSLREITDFERAMTRIMTGTASCRDLAALSQGAASLPAVKERLSGMRAPYLQTLFEQLDTLADLKEKIDATIVDDPPFLLREGGLIRDGANKELDELRAVQSGGKGMLTQIEAREKEKTGIRNLRVGYNRVFGYYIEVAKGQLNLVPDSYIRKQTLSTGERYITEELKELESTILTAKDRIVALEYDLFVALVEYHLGYDDEYEEWDRLEWHTPEFEVTKRYMEEYIPNDTPQKILDIGGGPGRYSIFLAQKGHDVTLFDLSGKNIRQAIEKAQEADVLLDSCIHGDALRLSEYLYKAEQYDVVLLMGPLYHLMREQDREKALQEALRVLKPGGLLFASFISTYAPIQDYASGLYDFGDMDRLLAGLEDGTAQPGKNFTNSYFCGEKEAEDMMEKAGLCQLAFAGVENILCGKEELLHKLASQQQEKWLNLAWRLSQDRKLLGMSEHFLYIGRKQ